MYQDDSNSSPADPTTGTSFIVVDGRADAVVLSVRGEVDMLTAPRLAEALDRQIRGGHPVVIADLREVDFMASSGLAVLIAAHQTAVDRRVVLRIVAPGRAVSRPIEATGLSRLLQVFATVEDATADLTHNH